MIGYVFFFLSFFSFLLYLFALSPFFFFFLSFAVSLLSYPTISHSSYMRLVHGVLLSEESIGPLSLFVSFYCPFLLAAFAVLFLMFQSPDSSLI